MPFASAYSSMTSERPRPGMRKNGAGAVPSAGGEDVEDLVAVFRQRTVVEGQHHLMVRQRQRLGILHGADDVMFARIDHERARCADRLGMARAIGCPRGGAAQQTKEEGGPQSG